MKHKYNNTVIRSQGGEHGKRVIEWWEKQGIESCGLSGMAFGGYYGLINDNFSVYDLSKIQEANAKIIELPDENLREQDWKTFTKDINPQDLIGRKVRLPCDYVTNLKIGVINEKGETVTLKYNLQDLIGRKVRGFEFDGSREAMSKYIGQIGIITDIYGSSYKVEFKDDFWFYPTHLIHEHLVDDDTNNDTSKQNVNTYPQIIDLNNVDGVEMMVSENNRFWVIKKIICKYKYLYVDEDMFHWRYAKPIEPVKKVTMQEVEELFGCKVEIVKEVSND